MSHNTESNSDADKEHYENYFYNSYDKDKLKKKYKNTNRLRKSPKVYKE